MCNGRVFLPSVASAQVLPETCEVRFEYIFVIYEIRMFGMLWSDISSVAHIFFV